MDFSEPSFSFFFLRSRGSISSKGLDKICEEEEEEEEEKKFLNRIPKKKILFHPDCIGKFFGIKKLNHNQVHHDGSVYSGKILKKKGGISIVINL